MGLDEVLSDACWRINEGHFASVWESSWSEKMSALAYGDEVDVILLSRKLREVFRSGGVGRTQGNLSIAGRNWKKLVWTSLSALSIGGRTLCLFGRGMIETSLPPEMRNKLMISVGNHSSLWIDPDFLIIHLTRDIFANSLEEFSSEVREDPSCIERITVVWAKTNFNDNIIRPMLWSWLGERQENGALEIDYAWFTVPSNKPERFAPGNAPLVRASTFSGGSYWGLGKVESLGMDSVFDAIEDWKDNLQARKSGSIGSSFLKNVFRRDY